MGEEGREGERAEGEEEEQGRDGEREEQRYGEEGCERSRAGKRVRGFTFSLFQAPLRRRPGGLFNIITEAALSTRGSRPASLPRQGEEERCTGRTCVNVRPNHSGFTAWLCRQGQRYPGAVWTKELRLEPVATVSSGHKQ